MQLLEGAAPVEWWDLFRLPALIRYAQEVPDALKDADGALREEIEARALMDYGVAYEKRISEHFPLLRFKTLLESFNTRSQLAQNIIDTECPGMDVSRYLNKKNPLCIKLVKNQELRWDLRFGRARFMTMNHLPDINQKFQKQIDELANNYQVLDKAFLLTAWNTLGPDDFIFINQAEIRWAQVLFSATDLIDKVPFVGGNYHAREGLKRYPKSEVEFLIARQSGKGERIYALHNKEQEYELKRIDKKRENYYDFFVDDLSSPEYADYKLLVYGQQQQLSSAEEDLPILLDRISTKHREDFATLLHTYGYEKTSQEKITEVLLSLIPFHTCISSIWEDRVKEIPLSCGLDAVSLLPLIGNLARISVKLGQVVGYGSIVALRSAVSEIALRNALQVVLKQGAKDFVRYGLWPASQAVNSKVWSNLALDMIRAMDPGIGVLSSMSRIAVQQMVQLGKSMLNLTPQMRHILSRLERQLPVLPAENAVNSYVMARQKGINYDIPVLMLGGDRYRGQAIYVKVNPQTGEAYGRKYLLLPNRILDPVPTETARHLQNILEQGLSGKNSPKQGVDWAPKSTEINAQVLRQLQREIAKGETLENLALTYNIKYEWLISYISNGGELTALGNEIVDLAEAGPSRSLQKAHQSQQSGVATGVANLPLDDSYSIQSGLSRLLISSAIGVARPMDLQASNVVRSIASDVDVKRTLTVVDGWIRDHDGIPFLYDIDLSGFKQKRERNSGFVYLPEQDRIGLQSITMQQAQDRSTSVSLDQRTAIIKALGIDLDLASVLQATPIEKPVHSAISKQISFIWVGDKQMSEMLISNLRTNCHIANKYGYKINFYLSEKSRELNFDNVANVLCDVEQCLPLPETNRLKILEKTNFYGKFSKTGNFAQYQDAIEGNHGIATNFASAADILRLALLKEKGGLYMDVDDMLDDKFGVVDLQTTDDGFVLSDLLSAPNLGMYYQFGNSFFGSHPQNPLIDDILQEIQRRYEEPENLQFYKLARPEKGNNKAMLAYTKKLSYLTGPDAFNHMLFKRHPAIRNLVEYTKLSDICYRPQTSQLLIDLEKKLPNLEATAPLSDTSLIGSLHSWKQNRK